MNYRLSLSPDEAQTHMGRPCVLYYCTVSVTLRVCLPSSAKTTRLTYRSLWYLISHLRCIVKRVQYPSIISP